VPGASKIGKGVTFGLTCALIPNGSLNWNAAHAERLLLHRA
jgi:hypothetical protein